MKAIVFEGPMKLAVREVPVPQVPEGSVLIKVSHAGICGSDMTIYFGKHPRAKAPLIFGHEFSGYIASKHSALREGTLVTVLPYLYCSKCEICEKGINNSCANLKIVGIDRDGGMAEYVAVPEDSIVPIPGGLSPLLTAFIEPIAITVHAVRRSAYKLGDSVVVFGAGPIGLATAITLRQYGAGDLLIVEPNPTRRRLAQSLGFDTINSDENTLNEINARTKGMGADCIFDCAGHQSVIDMLPGAIKIGGSIMIVAGYKNPPTMNFQQGMMKEFSILFTRNSCRIDFEIASKLILKDKGYEKLLNCVLPVEEAQKGFDFMSSPSDVNKVMFKFCD